MRYRVIVRTGDDCWYQDYRQRDLADAIAESQRFHGHGVEVAKISGRRGVASGVMRAPAECEIDHARRWVK